MDGHFFLGTESLDLCPLKEGNDCRQPKSRLRFIVNFFSLVRKFCFAFRELFELPSSVCGYSPGALCLLFLPVGWGQNHVHIVFSP